MLRLLLVVNIVAVLAGRSPHGDEYLAKLTKPQLASIPDDILEDALLDVPGLLIKYGYPVEIHEAETDDGYRLTMHRIPGGKNGKRADRPPVFLMHGLFSSSADWIINGPEQAFGYMLADEGYDVWMGNARGTFYSRKHATMDPDNDSKFWKFSWNEIGRYDLPAMIDYVLETTGNEKLHYVGHSQGTTSFFVMGSERPDYNDKILSMQAFAPVAYMEHARSPVITYLAPYASSLGVIFSLVGINEILSSAQSEMGQKYCHEESEYLPFCENILFVFGGYSPDQLNSTRLPLYMSHAPAGAASRQLIHYAQLHMSGRFGQFDHGFIANMFVYDKLFPPKYRMRRVTAPVALHYTLNDLLAEPEDVYRLHDELANPIGLFQIPLESFNHIDFIWGIDAKSLLYEKTLTVMQSLE